MSGIKFQKDKIFDKGGKRVTGLQQLISQKTLVNSTLTVDRNIGMKRQPTKL